MIKVSNLFFYIRLALIMCCGWLFLKTVFYKFLKICVKPEKKDLYSDNKYKKALSIYAMFKIIPPLQRNETERKQWESAWWKYASACVILFIIYTMI